MTAVAPNPEAPETVSEGPGRVTSTCCWVWLHPRLAVGQVLQCGTRTSPSPRTPPTTIERRKLNAAIDRALLDLSALAKRLEQESDADKAAIFAAHAEILRTPICWIAP